MILYDDGLVGARGLCARTRRSDSIVRHVPSISMAINVIFILNLAIPSKQAHIFVGIASRDYHIFLK